MITRRHFLKLSTVTAAMSALPSQLLHATGKPLVIWGPPVTPTVLLAIAAELGNARKIRPFFVKAWRTPNQLRAGLLNGSIEMSVVPSYVAANFSAQGQPVVLYNIMTNGLLSIMSKGKALINFEQLKHQKLIMPFKNDMPDLVLKILAQKYQINLTKLITYTPTPPESVALFLKKDFPNALLPEPLASAAILKGKKMGIDVKRSFILDKLWNQSFRTQHGIPQAGLMVSENMAKTESLFLSELNNDLKNAVEWVKNNPKSAAQIAAKYIPAPPPALEMAFPYSSLCAIPSQQIQDEIMTFMLALYELNPKIVGNKKPNLSFLG